MAAGSKNLKDRSKVRKEVAEANDGEVSDELFHTSNTYLHESVEKVFTQKELEDYETVNTLKRNASEFAIRKASYFTEALKEKDVDTQTAIMNTYERQLAVETNMAVRATRSAKQWQEFQRKKHLYPNLEYLSSSSADPRQEHIALYGTILPIDDPFWSTYFPPNGWGCKCSVQATRKDAIKTPNDLPPVPKGIPGNPGKEMKVFADDNSFNRGLSKEGKKNARNQMERMKQVIPYGKNNFEFKNGNSINVHPFADKKDLLDNIKYAKILAKTNEKLDIKIRPHSENVKTNIGTTGRKNPEYLINGKYADLKKVLKIEDLEGIFNKAIAQGNQIVVFRIVNDKINVGRLRSEIKGQINKNNYSFETIYIIKQEKVHKY